MLTQSQIKYNRLMEVSEDLFSKYGYKAVSMDEIADATGISKMTIYRYFSSKDELFINAVNSITDKTYEKIFEQLNSVEGTIEKIDVLLNFSLNSTNLLSLAFYKDVMDNKYLANKLIENKKIVSKKIFTEIISSGIEKGHIRQVNVEFIAELLNITVDGLLTNYSDILSSEDALKDFCANFYDFLKYGLIGR